MLAGALLYVLHVQLGLPPDPRAGGCDPADIAGSQALELARLSRWLLDRNVMGLALTAIATYAVLYFQAFHAWHVPLAWLGRSLVVFITGTAVSFLLRRAVDSWVAENGGSCLVEALQTNAAALGYSAQILPLSWDWGVFADAFAFAVLGGILGWLTYLLARRARF
jgi:hypothetical protein